MIAAGAGLVVVQQQLFPDSGKTLLAFASRVAFTLLAVVTPPEPVAQFLVEYLSPPAVAAGVLLWIVRWFLKNANQAMRQATPGIDPQIWQLSPAHRPSQKDSAS